MSNQEKSLHLKECLKTIGVYHPELSRFITRSLLMDKKNKRLQNKLADCDRRLEALQAKVMVLLLDL
jgi:hypothetical protein